jgi:succinate dehydrogenase/fumarate reductase flavoprotein subunit
MQVIDTDVVVVGGGGAGMAAASAAASLGRSVMLIEKNPALGGSTAWSVGSISVTASRQQLAQGIIDHPDAHFEDLDQLAGAKRNRDNLALRRVLVDNITETFRWLESTGLVFVGPNPEPPHRLPRMHNVLPNSRAFPEMLGRHCRRLGVDIRLGTLADTLLREGDRVSGISARLSDGRKVEIRARGGVVLAGGDYSASAEMKAELAGPDTEKLEAVNPTATGKAIQMGRDIGAEVINGDIVRGPIMRFIPPTKESLLRRLPPNRWLALALRWSMAYLPEAVQRPFAMSFLTTALGPARELFEAGAILVNSKGARFCDELDQPGHHVPNQPGKVAFIVLDQALARQFTAWPYFVSTAPGIAYAYLDDYRRNRRDIYHQAADIDGLASSLGVPAAALGEAIRGAAGGGPGGRPGLSSGPYVALGPVKSYVVFTDGGLKVTEQLEVVGPDGAAVPGLYAAGSTGQGGVLLEGHGHHLGWAFVSGRIAGRNAALRVPAQLGDEA